MESIKSQIYTRLLTSSCIEARDEIDEKLERCYSVLQNLTHSLSEKEAHDALSNAVCNEKTHEEVSLGLLVCILIEPKEAVKSYRDLTLLTRDGLAVVLSHLTQLVLERWLRLSELAKNQFLWLLREMIRTSVTNVEQLCLSLLRHAAGGDISQKNLSLIETLLDIFIENRTWLDKFPLLIASVIYTYLRLIEDHGSPHLNSLRQKEVLFTVSLIRDHILECLVIGRDMIRLLQNVARIPEFEALWKDILFNPKNLNPNFNGVLQILQTRTSRRFLQSRLTPDMERKLVFLTSQVRFGNHKRYQDWFQRQYLATPESQSLRCDLIRFIVGVIHPTNELLCSDIIPRWAVIGWLFTTCTSTVAASNAKLALFFDWLFFEAEKDNIMNIEPAILVMHNSMRSHPAVTATLLDFLCRVIPSFYPPLSDKVKSGIFSSLRQILEKRVLPSLCPLFDGPKLDRELRNKIRETFKDFCQSSNNDPGRSEDYSKDSQNVLFENSANLSTNIHSIEADAEGSFSDEDEESLCSKFQLGENVASVQSLEPKSQNYSCSSKVEETSYSNAPHLEPEKLRQIVDSLYVESDNEMRCQTMETIVQMIIEDEIDFINIPALAISLSNILSQQINSDIFPLCDLNEDVLTDSISTPLFVMFRNHFQLCKEEDPRKKLLARVLSELQTVQPRLGYLLLYFLKIWGKAYEKREGKPCSELRDLKANVYKDLCSQREEKFEACLISDLKRCHEDNFGLFSFLIPDIYNEFQSVAIGHSELMNLVVSALDASQLLDLVCQIMQGDLKMIDRDSLTPILTDSLSWDTFEQNCMWQIIFAHNLTIQSLLPVLSKLDFRNNAEALTSLILMMKQEKPTSDLLKPILMRKCEKDDIFVVTILKYWYREYEEKLTEILANLLICQYPQVTPSKRKRSSAKTSVTANLPTGEQILGHLDHLRQYCVSPWELQIYQNEPIRKALQQAQIVSSDHIRKTFGEMFALTESGESDVPLSSVTSGKKQQNLTTNKGSKKNASTSRERSAFKRGATRDKVADSSDESSEDEEVLKPKQSKKRKKISPLRSDSD